MSEQDNPAGQASAPDGDGTDQQAHVHGRRGRRRRPGEYLTVSPLPSSAGGVAGPIGLGFRTPCLVVSPFSAGGYQAVRWCAGAFRPVVKADAGGPPGPSLP